MSRMIPLVSWHYTLDGIRKRSKVHAEIESFGRLIGRTKCQRCEIPDEAEKRMGMVAEVTCYFCRKSLEFTRPNKVITHRKYGVRRLLSVQMILIFGHGA